MSADHPPAERDPHALGRLIAEHLAERGETASDVERRSGLHRATVHAMMRRPMRAAPRADTLERLAAGLELPLPVVQAAAARAAGFYVADLSEELPAAAVDPSVRLLVATAEELTPEHRRRLARMAVAYLEDVRREAEELADGER
jgi:transcriptional regulator with XRE-family HTH domain